MVWRNSILTSEYSSSFACSAPPFEGREHLAQRGDFLVAGVVSSEGRGHGFERRPGGDQFDDFAADLAHDIDAATRDV